MGHVKNAKPPSTQISTPQRALWETLEVKHASLEDADPLPSCAGGWQNLAQSQTLKLYFTVFSYMNHIFSVCCVILCKSVTRQSE